MALLKMLTVSTVAALEEIAVTSRKRDRIFVFILKLMLKDTDTTDSACNWRIAENGMRPDFNYSSKIVLRCRETNIYLISN
jgi:hypothetical protein